MKCDGFEDWSQVAKFRLHDFAFNNKLNHNEKKIIHFKLIFRSLLPLGWRLHHRNGPKRRFHGTGLEPSEAKRWRPVCHPGARFQAVRRRQYKSHQQWKQPEQHQHRTTADKWVIALFYFLIHSKKRVNKISCSRFKPNIFNNKKNIKFTSLIFFSNLFQNCSHSLWKTKHICNNWNETKKKTENIITHDEYHRFCDKALESKY